MAGKLNGEWKIVSSENFDEYMKALGVNSFVRKMIKLAKPKVQISIQGDDYSYKSVSSLRTMETKCKFGEEFQEDIPDGGKTQSTVVLKDGKCIHTQRWDGKQSTITRYVDENDNLIMEFNMEQVTSRRVYKRI